MEKKKFGKIRQAFEMHPAISTMIVQMAMKLSNKEKKKRISQVSIVEMAIHDLVIKIFGSKEAYIHHLNNEFGTWANIVEHAHDFLNKNNE